MKCALIAVCFCLCILMLQGQSSLRPAYIITLDGDTIKGEMEYKILSDQAICTFRNQGKEVQYSPDQIKGYRFENDKMMKSGIVKGKFVEQLVDGKLKLYRFNKFFYIQKDNGEVFLLDNGTSKIDIEENGLVKSYEKKSNRWIGVLKVLTNDAPAKSVNLSNLNYNYKGLTKVVNTYNQAVGSPSSEFLVQRKSNPSFGIMAGLHIGKIGVQNNNANDYILGKDYHVPRYDIGIYYYTDFPKISESIGFQGELHYFGSNQSATTSSPSYVSTIYTTNTFKYNGIAVPITVKYKLIDTPIKMNLQVGIEYDYILKSLYDSEFKRVYDNTSALAGMESVEKKSGELTLITSNIGYLAGIHVEKKLGNNNIGLLIRYSKVTNFKSGNNRFDHITSAIYTALTYSF